MSIPSLEGQVMRLASAISLATLLAYGSVGCDGASPVRAQSSPENNSEGAADESENPSEGKSPASDETGGEDTELRGPSGDLDGGAPAAAVSEESPFSDYDLESLAEAWQGNWVLAMRRRTASTAVTIDGGKAILYDPYSSRSGGGPPGNDSKNIEYEPHEFRIVSPCSWEATREREKMADHSFGTIFAFGDEKKVAGMGWGGVVTDEGAVVCFSSKIYELTESGCRLWNRIGSRWEEEDAECSLEDGTFKATETRETIDGTETSTRELERVGDIIVNFQLKEKEPQSFETFEAAKKAAEDEYVDPDPDDD